MIASFFGFGGYAGAAESAVAMLDPFAVTADRIEDMGFDLVGPGTPRTKGGAPTWTIQFVVPNTAAARAGLVPGERVLSFDGRPVDFRTWKAWVEVRRQKKASISDGSTVTWVLELERPDSGGSRRATLTLPSPPPHWGASPWRPPEDRAAVEVKEEGLLADVARTVLRNGVWTVVSWAFAPGKLSPALREKNAPPLLGYYWTVVDAANRPHTILVTQQNGRTDIVLETYGPGRGAAVYYLTSPGARLDEAVAWPGRKTLSNERAAAGFRAEVEFWTKHVGKVSPRWPLELLPAASAAKKP